MTAGQIRIDDGNNNLRFRDETTNRQCGAQITRTVNLAGATHATISYDYDEDSSTPGRPCSVLFAANGTTFITAADAQQQRPAANSTMRTDRPVHRQCRASAS